MRQKGIRFIGRITPSISNMAECMVTLMGFHILSVMKQNHNRLLEAKSYPTEIHGFI